MTSIDIVGFYWDYTVGNLATYPIGYKILFIDRDEIWEKVNNDYPNYLDQWVFKRNFVTKQPRSIKRFWNDSKKEQTSGFLEGQIDSIYPTTISKINFESTTNLFGKIVIYKNGSAIADFTPSAKTQVWDLTGNLISIAENDVIKVLLKSYLISNFPSPIYDKTIYLYNFDNDMESKIVTNKSKNMMSNYGFTTGGLIRNIISANNFTYSLTGGSVNFYSSKDSVTDQVIVTIEVSKLSIGTVFSKGSTSLSIVSGIGLNLAGVGVILSMVNLLLFSGNLVFVITFNQNMMTLTINGDLIYQNTNYRNPFTNNEEIISVSGFTGTLYRFTITDIDLQRTYLNLTDIDTVNNIATSQDDTQISAFINSSGGTAMVSGDRYKFGNASFKRDVSGSDNLIIPYHPDMLINDVAYIGFFVYPTVNPTSGNIIFAKGDLTKKGDLVLKCGLSLEYMGANSNKLTLTMDRDLIPNRWNHVVIKLKPTSVEVYLNSILAGKNVTLGTDFNDLWSTNFSSIYVGGNTRAFYDDIVLIRDDLGVSQYVSRTVSLSLTID